MRKWRIEDSAELYNINEWGVGYFLINDHGHMAASPRKDGAMVDLYALVEELQGKDVSTPMLLRFPDILDNRIEKMDSCFRKAASEYGYEGDNIIVYPVKVNQMQPVVQEIVNHGKKFSIGLEAGSKPELHAVIATSPETDSVIVCNGYKDEDYIELALLAQKMGRRIFIVVEKLNELKLILQLANRIKVKPNLGVRIKLASSGSGKWAESGGDQSKFGLTSGELLKAFEMLSEYKMESCLKMIHFHIGSQITKIRTIKVALREASQFFAQLYHSGYKIEYVDIGGGLGVDYDGTRSASSESSVNYSVQEYYNDVVYCFADVCNKNDLPYPTLITESGRSLTAHHSVLIMQVLEKTTHTPWDGEDLREDDHELVHEMNKLLRQL
jgi:arginine decarboxylase